MDLTIVNQSSLRVIPEEGQLNHSHYVLSNGGRDGARDLVYTEYCSMEYCQLLALVMSSEMTYLPGSSTR